MIRRRASMSALAVGACALSLVTGAPIASADAVLDDLAVAIDGVRARSGCGPLTDLAPLDAAARDYVTSGVLAKQGYPGVTTPFIAESQPHAAAIKAIVSAADYPIRDCRNVDLGVATVPRGDYTVIGIVLGSLTGPRAAQGS